MTGPLSRRRFLAAAAAVGVAPLIPAGAPAVAPIGHGVAGVVDPVRALVHLSGVDPTGVRQRRADAGQLDVVPVFWAEVTTYDAEGREVHEAYPVEYCLTAPVVWDPVGVAMLVKRIVMVMLDTNGPIAAATSIVALDPFVVSADDVVTVDQVRFPVPGL